MSASRLKRGWCPGVLRPMETGDGLLVRVRPRHGRLSRSQVLSIAEGAARFGNGAIDLSARSTLQIRGVSEAMLGGLVGALSEAGLVDESEAQEAARNIVLSPASDCDPAALIDAARLSMRIEPVIAEIAVTTAIASKFSLVIDDGGSFSLDKVAADIRLKAVRSSDRIDFLLAIAGDGQMALPLGIFGEEAAIRHLMALYVAAARLFPARRPKPAEAGLWAVEAGLSVSGFGEAATVPSPAQTIVFCMLQPVFGRLEARQLEEATSCLSAESPASFRPTTSRSLLVAPVDAAESVKLSAFASREGFLSGPRDPLAHVSACVGAPACRNASTDVRADALAAAAILGGQLMLGFDLHVSGCAKGCAHPAPAAIIMTAEAGLYRLGLDGKAEAAAGPALPLDQMLATLQRLTRAAPGGSSAER